MVLLIKEVIHDLLHGGGGGGAGDGIGDVEKWVLLLIYPEWINCRTRMQINCVCQLVGRKSKVYIYSSIVHVYLSSRNLSFSI